MNYQPTGTNTKGLTITMSTSAPQPAPPQPAPPAPSPPPGDPSKPE